MKTKLLKKVRKRYSVTRIEYVSQHEKGIHARSLRNAESNFGLPFFYIRDHNKIQSFDDKSTCVKHSLKAYEILLNMIKKDYPKRKKTVSKTVWWNSPNVTKK